MKRLILPCVILILVVTSAFSQTVTEDQQLASTASSLDRFGWSVDFSGAYAVVGAPQATSTANHGAAYVLEQQQDGTWTQVQTLVPSRATREFGHAVGIEGGWILIGAPEDETNGTRSGAVFVFQQQQDGTWTEAGEIIPAANDGSDEFGFALELQGDLAVIGAPGEGEDFFGATYVFERQPDNSWSEVDKVIANDASQAASFGSNVAIDGTLMAVGAWEDGANFDEEAVYVFEQQQDGTWSQISKLQPDTPEAASEFGSGLDIEGGLIVVGAYQYHNDNEGAAFIFEQQQDASWTQQAVLDIGGFELEIGRSVDLSGNKALVGAPGIGKAYLYEQQQNGTWSLLETLEPSVDQNGFGNALAFVGNQAIIGAPFDRTISYYQLGQQTVSFELPRQLIVGETFDLQASAASGLPITYTSSDPNVATVSNAGVIEAVAAGTVDIIISQAGDDYYQPFEEIIPVTVIDASAFETLNEFATLPSSALAEEGSQFGDAIAISGDFAVIGAPSRDEFSGFTTTDSGMGLTYQRQADGTWVFDGVLWPSDKDFFDFIASDVDIDGTRAIISATGDDDVSNQAGAAYIFDRQLDGTWVEQAKLTADDGGFEFFFGRSVAIQGDRAVVGSAHFDGTDERTGQVYVFERQNDGTWTQVSKFVSTEPTAYDYFGWSVDLDGDRILVGTIRDDDLGNSTGSASIFERQNDGSWTEAAKLLADAAGEDDQLGYAVALEGDRAVVGAPFSDIEGEDVGAAFVYDRQSDGTWLQVGKLSSPMVDLLGEAGKSVDLMGGKVLVGAPNSETGAVLYEEQNDGTWVMTTILSGTGATADDNYGLSVALGNGDAMVGGPLSDKDSEDSGAAFLFDLGEPDMLLEQTITMIQLNTVATTAAPFSLDAITNSGLTLSYSSSDETVATVSGDGTVTIVAEGTTTITVSQAGDGNYSPAEVAQTLTVVIDKSPQTITFPPLDPVEVGAADFTLNATVDSGLPLTYSSSDETVATVSNEGVVSILAEGTTDITVSQSGNDSFEPAESVTRTLIVNGVTSVILDDKEFKLYPVPFENYLFVESDQENKMEIKIYDMQGKNIPVATFKQKGFYRINTSKLDAGFYLIRINERVYKVVKR